MSTPRLRFLKARTQKTIRNSIVDKENNDYSNRVSERWASLDAKRFDDETFEDYKDRMRGTKKLLRAYMRGVRISSEEYAKTKKKGA